MIPDNTPRIRRLIKETIELFDLDLQGLSVLTEAANGYFYVTPVIAVLSGATVYALARDSQYGKKEELARYLIKQAGQFNLPNQIEIIYELGEEYIRNSDIITNLGSLRPLDAGVIRNMNHRAIITSMCENWEIRDEDIDRAECRKRDILIGAVNEESSHTNIFRYVGFLAMKLVMDSGLEILNNRYLVISSDKFGRIVTATMQANGAAVQLCNPEEIESGSIRPGFYDALICADYSYDRPIISANGLLTAEKLKQNFTDVPIIHLAGEVDCRYLRDNQISCYPEKQGYKRKMSRTLDYLGPRPLIELHTAGLKVGEILCRERKDLLSIPEIKKKLADHPFCQIVT